MEELINDNYSSLRTINDIGANCIFVGAEVNQYRGAWPRWDTVAQWRKDPHTKRQEILKKGISGTIDLPASRQYTRQLDKF